MIGNVVERMELDAKLSELKTSRGLCNMRKIKYLEEVSIFTATTESSACISDTEDITSESVDADYATTLDDDSVINEILVAGTT